MYAEILVPTDGSDASMVAVEQGVELAAEFDATVHFLHVVDVGTEMSASGVGNVANELTTTLIHDILHGNGTRSNISETSSLSQFVEWSSCSSTRSTIESSFSLDKLHLRNAQQRNIVGKVTEFSVPLFDLKPY